MDSTAYKNHDEYIIAQPLQLRPILEQLRQCIKKAAPLAEEVISYQMPAFRFHGMLAYYALFKNHFSLFVSPEVLQAFKNQLTAFSTTKSAIHFPFNVALPDVIINEIILFALRKNLDKKLIKDATKRKKIKK